MSVTAPSIAAETQLRVALVRRAHGVRGELRVLALGGDAARFRAGTRLRDEGSGAEHVVAEAKGVAGGDLLLRLEDVSSRDRAEALAGVYLCVERAGARQLGADEWFEADLVGLRCLDAEGRALGVVEEVEEYAANDVLVVRSLSASAVRVPLVRDFVRRVAPDDGVVELLRWDELVAVLAPEGSE